MRLLSGVRSRPARLQLLAVAGVAALGAGLLTIVSPAAQAAVFTPTSTTQVGVADGASTQTTVRQTGAGGLIEDVNVTLNGLSSSVPSDLTIQLVSPAGTPVTLMSGDCGTSGFNGDLTFNQQSGSGIGGSCAAGGNYVPVSSLGALNNTNPWGDWTIVLTDAANGNGSSTTLSGFSVNITTGPFQTLLPKTGNAGTSLLYPLNFNTTGKSGTVTDVNVQMTVSHTSVGDIDALLVSPKGTAVWITSDACGAVSETNVTWMFDQQANGTLPASGSTASCGSGSYRPSNDADGDSDAMPSPAPAGPYGTSLSAFNGQPANGRWKLFLNDDNNNGGGGFINSATVNVVTTADQPDTTAPQTRITHRPKHKIHRRHVHFSFTSSEAGSHFQCKVDNKAWKSCKSALKTGKLRVHRHRFKVRAIDAAGNVDATPAIARWRVLARPGQFHHTHHDPHHHDTHQ